jgi:hypothetical protein
MKLHSFTEYLFIEKLNRHSEKDDTWIALRFANLLRLDFREWDAFKLKLIDDRGNILRQPKNRKEETALGLFERLIIRIKKAIYKYGGKNYPLASLIGLYLLQKESYTREEHNLKSMILEELSEDEIFLFEDILTKIKHKNITIE